MTEKGISKQTIWGKEIDVAVGTIQNPHKTYTADLIVGKAIEGVRVGKDDKPAGTEIKEVIFDVKNQEGGILEPRIKLDGAFFQELAESGRADYRVKLTIEAEYVPPNPPKKEKEAEDVGD